MSAGLAQTSDSIQSGFFKRLNCPQPSSKHWLFGGRLDVAPLCATGYINWKTGFFGYLEYLQWKVSWLNFS